MLEADGAILKNLEIEQFHEENNDQDTQWEEVLEETKEKFVEEEEKIPEEEIEAIQNIVGSRINVIRQLRRMSHK